MIEVPLVIGDFDAVPVTNGDSVVVFETRTPAPWCQQLWCPDGAIEYRNVDGKWLQRDIAMPHPDDDEHSEVYRFLNWRRQQTGLLPVGYRESPEDGISKHCIYCARTRHYAHEERANSEFHTAEGAAAGMECIFGFEKSTIMAGIKEQFATIYHRDGMLSPGLSKTAFVLVEGVFGLNIRAHETGDMSSAVAAYPPHGMVNVRVDFNRAGEAPMPVAERRPNGNGLGVPISMPATRRGSWICRGRRRS